MRTKAVFVDLEQDIYDRHGVYALSGVLKRDGVDVRYLASRNENDILRDLSKIRPRFVLSSTYSSYFSKYAAFDRAAQRDAHVVLSRWWQVSPYCRRIADRHEFNEVESSSLAL